MRFRTEAKSELWQTFWSTRPRWLWKVWWNWYSSVAHNMRKPVLHLPDIARHDTVGCWKKWRLSRIWHQALNVVRNKGAPGVDGQTVEDAQRHAARSSPSCVMHC